MRSINQYLGILLGVVYGVIIRLLGTGEVFQDYYNIYSITFIWITPIIIGLFPILFASSQIYKSKAKLFFYPIITVILFLVTALITRLEDLICLLIIGMPFLGTAGIMGIFFGSFVKDKVKDNKMYSIILLPLVLNPIENILPNRISNYSVSSEIIIYNNNRDIFPNLLEVPVIEPSEYKEGFYQLIGVPRPIKSQMIRNGEQLYRIGYFTDDLFLYEYVTVIRDDEFVNFKIDLPKSHLRDTPTDQHLLKSKYFNFENINYTLIPVDVNTTKVILKCDYLIESKMNFYANFWASSIIQDFEKRLLSSLKLKIEQ